jgi:adenylyltransferase/sulfurtransferase
VLGVVPGVIGSLQALETVKLILGAGDSLAGRLLIFDALESSWREVRLRRDPDCPLCGDDPSQTSLIDYDLFCGVHPEPSSPWPETVEQISPRDLEARLATDPPPLILDVREPYEWEIGNLAPQGARLIPMGEIRSRLEEIPRDRAVVVFCHVGVRSAHVATILADEGFSDIANLTGGYLAWAEEVDPDLPRY